MNELIFELVRAVDLALPEHAGTRMCAPSSSSSTSLGNHRAPLTGYCRANADHQASSVLIAMTAMIIVFCVLNLAYLRYANRKKAERRAEQGGVIDTSTWHTEGDRHPHFIYSY